MSYQENIVTNPDASTGDTTGWIVNNVTVVGGTTAATFLKVRFGDLPTKLWGGWLDYFQAQLAHSGDDDSDYFLVDDGDMEQEMLSGFSVDFKDGRLTCVFKFVTDQDAWDANVIAKACADIEYDDETKSIFVIPCVKGLTYEGRDLPNSWYKEEAICQ